jgi:uncharacterized damage-inducible protein DinB
VSDAPSHVERNRAELERMRAIVAELDDDALGRPVNESWTVAGVLGHIAFWDGRALFLAEKLSKGEPFTQSDEEPEDVDWINDAARPLIHAIPARRTAELALRVAADTDERIASLSPDLLAKTWPSDPRSPLNALRADHRAEHLDEMEAALRT